MFILDILHPADVLLLTNPVHADGLVHPAHVVLLADCLLYTSDAADE